MQEGLKLILLSDFCSGYVPILLFPYMTRNDWKINRNYYGLDAMKCNIIRKQDERRFAMEISEKERCLYGGKNSTT